MRLLFTLFLNLLTICCFSQRIRYVSTFGSNTDPAIAISWTTSTTDLQGAINASKAGDQVWVAKGTYQRLNNDFFSPAAFTLKDSVSLYGGFRGDETSLSQRPLISPSAGVSSGTILSSEYEPGFKFFHVVSHNTNLSANTLLDGFTIADGFTLETPFDYGYGGGLKLVARAKDSYCAPHIQNCTFQGNSSQEGGAVALLSSDSGVLNPTFSNCRFKENKSINGGSGGAVYIQAIKNSNNKSHFANCLFDNNSALNGGCLSISSIEAQLQSAFTSCAFSSNRATQMGGVLKYFSADLTFTNCTFNENGADSCSILAKPIYPPYYQPPVSTNTVNIINSLFWNNKGATLFDQNVIVKPTYSAFDSQATDLLGGTGNKFISSSPFAGSGTLRLAPNSPAINAALSSAPALQGLKTDLAGQPRISDCTVDMGAYEFTGEGKQAIASATISPVSQTVCAGTSIGASVSTDGTGQRYQWYKENIAITGQTTATLTASQVTSSGTYQVVVSGDCESQIRQSMTIVTRPIPEAPVLSSVSRTVYVQPEPVTLAQFVVPAAKPFSFSTSNGQSASALVDVSQAGAQEFRVAATDENGCVSAITSFTLIVSPLLSIEPISPQTLQLIPQPNPLLGGHMRVLIRGAGQQTLTLRLINLRGEVIKQKRWQISQDDEFMDWDIHDQPAGLYLLNADTNQQSTVLRLQKTD